MEEIQTEMLFPNCSGLQAKNNPLLDLNLWSSGMKALIVLFFLLVSVAANAGTKIKVRPGQGMMIWELETNLPKDLGQGTFGQDFLTDGDAVFVRSAEFLASFQGFLADCGVNVSETGPYRNHGLGPWRMALLFQKEPKSKNDFDSSKGKGIIEIKEFIEVKAFSRLIKEGTGEEYWLSGKREDPYGNTTQVEAYIDSERRPVWFRLETKNPIAKDPIRAILFMGSKWKKTCHLR